MTLLLTGTPERDVFIAYPLCYTVHRIERSHLLAPQCRVRLHCGSVARFPAAYQPSCAPPHLSACALHHHHGATSSCLRPAGSSLAGAAAAVAAPAAAVQTLTDASGTEFEAFELPFTLNVLARQGAMSQAQVQQVVADHKKMVGVRLATAPTHGVRCFS